MLRLGTAMALVVAVAVTARSQQQPPIFKAGTHTVPLFATVTDATGRLIPDLVKEDFEISLARSVATSGTRTQRRNPSAGVIATRRIESLGLQ